MCVAFAALLSIKFFSHRWDVHVLTFISFPLLPELMNASIVKSSRLAPSRAAIRPGARRLVAISKAEQGNKSTEEVDKVPPGCSRYIAKLAKPLGIVLEETKDGRLLVGDVQVGGNAERYNETATADRIIRKGDQIVAVSGFTRAGASQTYGETEVRGGEKMVRVIVMAQPQDKYVSKTSTCAQLPGGTLTRPDSLTRSLTLSLGDGIRPWLQSHHTWPACSLSSSSSGASDPL